MNEIVLSLFGALQITLNGKPISGIDSDKVRALFVFLAVEADQTHRRDALAEMFWPDKPEGDGRKNLRQSLANLRKSIGDRGSASPFLISSRDKIQFNAGSSCTIDSVEFQDLIKNTQDHAHESLDTCGACSERLERAVELYQGDFLEQFYLTDSPAFEEWSIRHRENLQRQMSEVMRGLISIQEKQNDLRIACEYARKLVTLEPWSEGNHRLLMRLLALSGNRSAALKQYHTCQQILAAELGVDPAKETTDLYEQIKEWELGIPSQSDLIAPLVDEAAPALEPDSEARSRRLVPIWIRGLLAIGAVLAVGYALNYAVNVRTTRELVSQQQPVGTEQTSSTPTTSQALSTQDVHPNLPIAGDGYEIGELLFEDDFQGPLSHLWGYEYGHDPWLTEEVDGRSVLVANMEQTDGMGGGDWRDYVAQFDFYLSKPNHEGYYSLHVSTRTYGCSAIEFRPNRYLVNLTPEGIHFDRNACESDQYFSLINPYPVSPREWHTLQIFNYHEKYRVVLDEVEIFNITIDPPVESGGVLFEVAFRGVEYYIDHFRIYELVSSEG
ncbi:MAG: BTAD domain-containing putative transcriptional regulator [Anaerolineales bacterium]